MTEQVLPGNRPEMEYAVQALNRAGENLSDVASQVGRLEPVHWRGLAAEAYKEKLGRDRKVVDAIAEISYAGSKVLQTYLVGLATLEAQAVILRQEMQQNLDLATSGIFSPQLAFNLQQNAQAWKNLFGLANQLANITAQELLNLTSSDENKSLGAPGAWQTEHQLEPIAKGILDDPDSFNSDKLKQRGIGDCYLMAPLKSLLRTEEGKQLLRDNVRWDPKKKGYWVSFYPEVPSGIAGMPNRRKKVEVFVNEQYTDGARNSGGKENIATIYEAAYGKYRRSGWFGSDIDSGKSQDAFSLITGKDPQHYSGDGWFNDGYNDETIKEVKEQLAQNRPVVASTYNKLPEEGQSITGGTQVLVRGHVYVVTKIESNGDVWVQNPHGPGNPRDHGDPFKVVKADFDKYFDGVTVSGEL